MSFAISSTQATTEQQRLKQIQEEKQQIDAQILVMWQQQKQKIFSLSQSSKHTHQTLTAFHQSSQFAGVINLSSG